MYKNMTEANVYLNKDAARKVARVLIAVGTVLLLSAFSTAMIGGLGAVADGSNAAGVTATARGKFFHAYLFSYVFFMALCLGALFFVVLQFLTRSQWSVTVRRVAEAVTGVIPLMIGLALPILLLGMGTLYHWTHTDAVADDAVLQSKAGYLNLIFFYARSVVYFAFFYFAARFYRNSSSAQDTDGDPQHTVRMQKFSPLVTLLFAVIVTFFAFDYLMSLTPHWYSTIWGIYYFAGAIIGALCFMVLVFLVLRRLGYLKKEVTVEHYHDLGKLIFAFNIFWSYIAFSQYLLIWFANIPEDTLFFINRINGTWRDVSVLLIVGHFLIPLLFYISRNAKRSFRIQLIMTAWLLFMRVVDFYWIVMPNSDVDGLAVGWLDLAVFFGMGSLFMGVFILSLARHALIPIKDPRLEYALKFENA